MASAAYDGGRIGADDPRRRRLLDAAIDIVYRGGAGALSVRSLADAVGASTKVIYTHFGGKDGVVAAVYDDAFERLAATLQAAANEPGTPTDRVRAVAAAYRSFALESPDLYRLMYSSDIRELRPEKSDRAAAAASLATLTEVLSEVNQPGPNLVGAARDMWAAMHGVISLELADWFDPEEGRQRFNLAVARVLEP